MHHSLFGDSGLGMDLGSLMAAPPTEDPLLPDIAAQLFDEVAAPAPAQGPAPPPSPTADGGECSGGGLWEGGVCVCAGMGGQWLPELEPCGRDAERGAGRVCGVWFMCFRSAIETVETFSSVVSV